MLAGRDRVCPSEEPLAGGAYKQMRGMAASKSLTPVRKLTPQERADLTALVLSGYRRDLTMSLLELFCDVDDFMLNFAPQWRVSQLTGSKQRERAGQLCPSEVMTIPTHFHQSHYRTFKVYYTEHWSEPLLPVHTHFR